MHEHYSVWQSDFSGPKQLRPVHYAIFTDRWDWHGRIYTGRYGHQSLRKIERNTTLFNGSESVESDFGGMHPRLLYHLKRIDYKKDPYRLWGKKTTPAHRMLAKTLINTALNAKTRQGTIDSCNHSLSPWTDKPDKLTGKQLRKSGESLEKAIALYQAYKNVGLGFDAIYDLAVKRHQPIAHHFGTDAGIWLMRIESSIAIDIMYWFAKQAIPCLCVHDSFVVPKIHDQKLREKMNYWYHQHLGFYPIVKS